MDFDQLKQTILANFKDRLDEEVERKIKEVRGEMEKQKDKLLSAAIYSMRDFMWSDWELTVTFKVADKDIAQHRRDIFTP